MSVTPQSAATPPDELPEGRRLTLVALALIWPAQLLAVVGVLSGNAQPLIAQHFHTTQIVWFSIAFVLVSLVTMPFAMRLGDIFGKRRVMLVLTAAGLMGDLVAVLAPNFEIMLVGRAIGGLYGPVVPLVMASVREIFPAKRIAAVYGALTGSIGIALVVSPLVAGQLLDHFGWQSALWALVISTGLAGLCLTIMPETSRRGTMAGFDWLGGLLLGCGVAALVYGIGQDGQWGWTATGTLVSLVGGVLALAAFTFVELRAAHPVVDVRMLRRRSVATVLAGPGLAQGVFFVSPVVLTFLVLFPPIPHVSDGLGWTVTHNAIVGIPAGIITTAAGIATGRMMRSVGPRPLWFTGSTVLVAGLVLAGLFHADEFQVIATAAVIGLGGGMVVATVSTMITSVVSVEEQAAANGLSTLLVQASGALTYQLLFVVLARHSVAVQGTAFYLDVAYRNAFFTLAGLIAVGIVLSLAMPRLARPDEQPA